MPIVYRYYEKAQNATADGMSFRECLSDDGDIFSTAMSLFIRKFPPGDLTPRKDVPSDAGVRGGYGNPTLRAMHSIYFLLLM